MIARLNEHNKSILIEGLISDRILEFNKLFVMFKEFAPNSVIQLMDGKMILGYEHILFAVFNSLNGKQNNRMICEDLSLEILVYASAQRQIKNSIEIVGVKQDSKQLVLTAASTDIRELEKLRESILKIEGLHLDNSFLESKNHEILTSIKNIFNISDKEVESIHIKEDSDREVLEKLIIERMALLSVNV